MPTITEQITGIPAAPVKPAVKAEPETVVEQTPPAETPTQEPKGRTVPFNKEPKFVPEEEVDTYLQKGLHLDKVQKRLDDAQAQLLKAAKVNGYEKVDDYLKSLDTKEQEEVQQSIEDAFGYPDKMDQAIRKHPLVRQAAEIAERATREAAKSSLKNERFYAELEPELDKVFDANPGVDPDIAYNFLIGRMVRDGKMDEMLAQAKKSAKEQAAAELHDQARRGTPKGIGGSAAEQKPVPTGEKKKIQQAFGLIK